MTTLSSNGDGPIQLKAKDFATDQDVRWCPGCGDYSILKQVQSVFADLGKNRDNVVFVSGIGCSSRFPYYMETYGMHSIHGRAPAIAAGLKMANPGLDIWVITGDGDGLSIGGNHLLHAIRRNFNLKILLFNNQIYGLTKGQYSPTSEIHKKTVTTPMGSIDHPLNPLMFALGANSTFIGRTMDRDPKHLQEMIRRCDAHQGTTFLEIYQNCNIFNDGAFFTFTEKESKPEHTIMLTHGQPLVFGQNQNMGIRLDGWKPVIVDLEKDGFSKDDLWIHDETDQVKAFILTKMFDDPSGENALPRPFGVFFQSARSCYEALLFEQIDEAKKAKPGFDLDKLIAGSQTWEIA